MTSILPNPARVLSIRGSMRIAAPLDRAFRLSTSVPLVRRTLGFTPVEGVTDGHVEMGSRVLWTGWLFGLPQRHMTLITGYEPPHSTADGLARASFQDTQESGRFRFFQHDHHMTELAEGGTLLEDEIRFTLPFGYAGYLVGRLVLQPFIRRTLRSRLLLLAEVAGSDQWHKYA